MDDLTEHFVELVRRTSTDLPADVEKRLKEAREREEPGSAAQGAFDTILENINMSRGTSRPICQDTGTPIFYVWYPEGWSQRKLREQITRAVQLATEKSYLRPNAVEAISGKLGDNTGVDFPTIHFEEWEHDLRVGLMLKGGGCENVGGMQSPILRVPRQPRYAGRAQGCARCRLPGARRRLRAGRVGRCHWRRPGHVRHHGQRTILPSLGRQQR
jgi:fumarate hydratase class I